MPPPISTHPANPRIFLFRGKPTLLITSGEHYGAVLNRGFDYSAYLETLAADRLNLTRTFSGTYREEPGNFGISLNTLAPCADAFICPWPRSDRPGAADGGARFDLSRWDPEYFRRLRAFIREAGRRGVVVEYTLFCPLYEDSMWNLSPMNERNNVNGIGAVPREETLTLKHRALVEVQLAFARKAASELRGFDNVIVEICNEPYFGGVTLEWQREVARAFHEAEAGLPARHLISQNIANNRARVERPFPEVSVFQFHYARPPVTVAENWGLNRPIGCNETGFDGQSDFTYRSQGWEFLLAGGAVYNNLDYSFTAEHPRGTYVYPSGQPGGGSPALRRQLRCLRDFLESFDLVRLRPAPAALVDGLPRDVTATALVDPGRACAVYFKGGSQVNPRLDVPAGRWRAEWLNPVTGEIDKTAVAEHAGGRLALASPRHQGDIALRLTAA